MGALRQADELRALAGLARDAGEILFEMAAMHDDTEAAQDMLEKSQQLEVRLWSQTILALNDHSFSVHFLAAIDYYAWSYVE